MILVATSWTSGYAWGDAYRQSLEDNCKVPFECFSVGWHHPGMIHVPRPGTRGDMVQHGSFLENWPTDPNALIVFTDADMIMQRHFNEAELFWLERIRVGQVALARNLFADQTLEQEARLIEQTLPDATVERLFPHWQSLRAWNCGVIAARRRTYEQLYAAARAALPACYWCFAGMPAIQWLLCYCVGRFFEHVEMPRSMHVHGHVDPGPEVSVDNLGRAWVANRVAVFRHNLNLNPPTKGFVKATVQEQQL